MERFGDKKAFDELNGSGIHRLENILTLSVKIFSKRWPGPHRPHRALLI